MRSGYMQKKSLHAKDKCPRCGESLFCNRKKDGSGLQWQNWDGGAHFGYDSGEFFCRDPAEYPAKYDGAEKECEICGTWIYCRWKSYRNYYPDSLQWQNENGKAHYRFVDNGAYACNVEKEKEEDNKKDDNS